MYPFLEELFVRGAVRLFLGLELHEIYAHKQHEHRDENYGGKRVHIGLNRFFRHRVYLERQSYEIRARCIVAYHEIVDRKRERHEESRKDSGRNRGEHHLEECLHLVAPRSSAASER